jgi:hypothetical protein
LAEKKRFIPNIDPGEEFTGIDQEISDIAEFERKLTFIGKSLEDLGEPCRSLIEGFYIHDLSMEDLRDKHGYTSADNAKNQKYKCLQRLKKIFFAHYKTAL